MSDIRTTTEEFSVSGSLSNVQSQIESTEPVFELQETVQFLVKKIDELIGDTVQQLNEARTADEPNAEKIKQLENDLDFYLDKAGLKENSHAEKSPPRGS